jgi:hypothetical protein
MASDPLGPDEEGVEMYDPRTSWVAEEHRTALLVEARRRRAWSENRRRRPRLEPLALRLAAVLIATGLRLQRRYRPLAPLGADAPGSARWPRVV